MDLEELKKASEIFFNFTSPIVALTVGYWTLKKSQSKKPRPPRKKPKHRGG